MCWAAALLPGAFTLFFQTSRRSSGPTGSSQPYFLGAGPSGLGWASSLLMTSLGSTCSPKSSSMLLCRVSVRRRASRGRRLLQGQSPGPALRLAAAFPEPERSSSSLPQSRPLSGLLVAQRPDRLPLSSRTESSAWGPAAGPQGSAGNREPGRAWFAGLGRGRGPLAARGCPMPCLRPSSLRSASSSATSGILHSLCARGPCAGRSGCSRSAASGPPLSWHSWRST